MWPATGFPVGPVPLHGSKARVCSAASTIGGVRWVGHTGSWGRCLFSGGRRMGARLPVFGTVPLLWRAHLCLCWWSHGEAHASPSLTTPGAVTLVHDAGSASFTGWAGYSGPRHCTAGDCVKGHGCPTHLLHRPRRERLLWSMVLEEPPSPRCTVTLVHGTWWPWVRIELLWSTVFWLYAHPFAPTSLRCHWPCAVLMLFLWP